MPSYQTDVPATLPQDLARVLVRRSLGVPSFGAIMVIFDTEVFDVGNMFSPPSTTITIPSSGIYHVGAMAQGNGLIDLDDFFLSIQVNFLTRIFDAKVKRNDNFIQPPGSPLSTTASGLLVLNAGDALTLTVTIGSHSLAEFLNAGAELWAYRLA